MTMIYTTQYRYTLALGRNIGTDGLTVTDDQLQRYLDFVSEFFPAFSVSYGSGYWEGNPETSVYVTIVLDSSEPSHHIDTIASDYNSRFEQQCVMVTREKVEVCFHEGR